MQPQGDALRFFVLLEHLRLSVFADFAAGDDKDAGVLLRRASFLPLASYAAIKLPVIISIGTSIFIPFFILFLES